MQRDALLSAVRADVRQRLHDSDLTIGEHDGDEKRVSRERVSQLLDVQSSGRRRIVRRDRQERHAHAVAAKSSQRIKHRFVFRLDADHMVPLTAWVFGQAAEGQVVALRRAAGEHDFAGIGVQGPGDRASSLFNGLVDFRADRVAGTGRVAVLFAEVRQHGGDDPRIDSRGGMVIEIDGGLNHLCHAVHFSCAALRRGPAGKWRTNFRSHRDRTTNPSRAENPHR